MSLTRSLTRPLTRKISRADLTQGFGGSFSPFALDPYLLFDARDSMVGTLENPTLDLNPALPETLDVITATRAGIATYTDSSGLIKAAPANTVRVDYTQGAELTPTKFQNIGYTDFSNGWITLLGMTVASAGTFNGQPAHRLTTNGNANNIFMTSTPTVEGVNYVGSFYIRRISGSGTLVIRTLNSASGAVLSLSAISSEWTRMSVSYLGRIGGGLVEFGFWQTDAGNDVYEISQPQVEEGTTATDFVANTTGSPKFTGISATYAPRVPMILCEPSATNLIENSEDFSQDVTLSNCSLVSGFSAPDSSSNAFKLVEDNTNSLKLFRANNDTNTTASTSQSASIFVKAGERTKVRVYGYHLTNQKFSVDYDLNGNQFLGTNTSNSQVDGHSIEDYGDGWKRITVTGQKAATYSWDVGVSPLDDSGNVTYTGDGTSGVYIWGAQLEESSVATSYIPTSGSTVTRAADELSIDPDSTNHITNTDFSTWATTNMTVATGGGYSGRPSSIITATGSTGSKFLRATLSGVTAGQTHTASIYVRRVSGSGSVEFEHQGSTAGGDQNVTSQVGSDWNRIDTQFNGSTSGGVVTSFAIRLFTEGDALEIAMPQVELGSSPTGFIPTSGAAASRTTFSDFYNQSEGTFYMESTGRGYFDYNTSFAFSDNSSANRIYARSTSNSGGLTVFSGGSVSASMGGLTVVANNVLSRSAHSFKANNFLTSRDGNSATPDTNGNMPAGIDRLYIGASQIGGNQLNGHIKRVIYWPYHSDSL